MLQKKRQTFRQAVRRKQIQKVFKQCRERQALKRRLKEVLQQYPRCGLVTGEKQSLKHTEYLHCLSFVFYTHEELFSIIVELGVAETKQLLLEYSLAKRLREVFETVDERTLETDLTFKDAHYKFTQKALESITDLVCLFTQDYELISLFGDLASQLFVRKLQMIPVPGPGRETKWENALLGLINLFNYGAFSEETYIDLTEMNFQLYVEKYFRRLLNVSQNILHNQFATHLLILLRCFLQYKDKNENKKMNPILQKILRQFFYRQITDFFDHYSQQSHKCSSEDIIDEMLACSLYFDVTLKEEDKYLQVLKNKRIFRRISYVRLLSHYSVCQADIVKLGFFSNEQIEVMLQGVFNRQYSLDLEEYLGHLASALCNMLENEGYTRQATERLWNLLAQTKTTDYFYDSIYKSQGLCDLTRMLDGYDLQDL